MLYVCMYVALVGVICLICMHKIEDHRLTVPGKYEHIMTVHVIHIRMLYITMVTILYMYMLCNINMVTILYTRTYVCICYVTLPVRR